MRAPPWIVPALVVLCAVGGIQGARLFSAPSVVRDYEQASPGAHLRAASFVVQGIRCVDTAEAAARQLDGVPGVIRLKAYASEGRAEVTYDSQRTDEVQLKEAIEAPVYDDAGSEFRFGVYTVVEVNGERVERP